jgi:hypothetical protein
MSQVENLLADVRLEQSQHRDLLHQILERINQVATALDTQIQALQTAVANAAGVEQSAVTLLQGLSAAIATILTQLAASGVTQTQLQSLTDLSTAITTQTTQLAAAVAANPVPPAAAPKNKP